MAKIKIATGRKVYDIEDENGNIRGQVTFDPSDFNIVQRIKAFQKNLDAYLQTISDDTPTEDILAEMDAKVKEELNKVFDDENASDVFFGNQSCLSMYKGEFFIERVLMAFIPVIEKDVQAEAKKSASKISKYTDMVN